MQGNSAIITDCRQQSRPRRTHRTVPLCVCRWTWCWSGRTGHQRTWCLEGGVESQTREGQTRGGVGGLSMCYRRGRVLSTRV
jgi:hypothetical protein